MYSGWRTRIRAQPPGIIAGNLSGRSQEISDYMDDDTEYNDSGDEDEPRIPLPLIFNEAEWGLVGRISDYIDNSLEKLLMDQQTKKQKII